MSVTPTVRIAAERILCILLGAFVRTVKRSKLRPMNAGMNHRCRNAEGNKRRSMNAGINEGSMTAGRNKR